MKKELEKELEKELKRFIRVFIAVVILALCISFNKYLDKIEHDRKFIEDAIFEKISDVKDYDVEEIIAIGLEEYDQGNQKMAYNLFDLAISKIERTSTANSKEEDIERVGVIKMYKAICCYDLGNYIEAIELIEESIDMTQDWETDNIKLNKKNLQSAIYAEYTSSYGFEKVKNTEKVLLELINLNIEDENLQIEKNRIDTESKVILARLYSLAPELYNPEKSIEIYLELLEDEPNNTKLRYSLIHVYIQNQDYEQVKIQWDELVKYDISEINNQVIGTLYYLGINEPEKAAEYLVQMEKYIDDDLSKIKYYQVSSNYYAYFGDNDKGIEYLELILDIDENEIFTKSFIELEGKINADYSKEREKIIKENKKNGDKDLSVPWEVMTW